jgi:hypothetical protein
MARSWSFSRWLEDAIAGSVAEVLAPPEETPELERLDPLAPVVLPRSTFTPADSLEGTADGLPV